MGIFEKLFRKIKSATGEKSESVKNTESSEVIQNEETEYQKESLIIENGFVKTVQLDLDTYSLSRINSGFVALDVETTGLSSYLDRIIEIGVVRFRDGAIINRFNTLVQTKTQISKEASRVNHITQSMIDLDGIPEKQAYKLFSELYSDVLCGETIVCAHNASFDLDFLAKALEREGYSGTINYVDTLLLSRKIIKGLQNYKQSTVAAHFNIDTTIQHRAGEDAEVCGRILLGLLEEKKKINSETKEPSQFNNTNRYSYFPEEVKKNELTDEELELSALFIRILRDANCDTSNLTLYKSSSGFVDIFKYHAIIRFKIGKKGRYLIMDKGTCIGCGLTIKNCTNNEVPEKNERVYFDSPSDIESIADKIVERFYRRINISQEKIKEYNEMYGYRAGQLESIENLDISLLADKAVNRYKEFIRQKEQEEKNKAEKLEERQKSRDESKKKSEDRFMKLQEEHSLLQQLDSSDSIDEQLELTYKIYTSKGMRPVVKKDDTEIIVTIYPSVAEASKDTGINAKSIREAATGKQKHAGGYQWSYVESEINLNK